MFVFFVLNNMTEKEKEEKELWIGEMIKRQMLPIDLRIGTVENFCKKYKISDSTYYYQCGKSENQAKIISGCLMLAKEYTADIMGKLGEKAKQGDMKAIDMFLNYVLKLRTNVDLKTDIQTVIGNFNYINPKDNSPAK